MRIARAVEGAAGRSNASTVILSIDNAELLLLEDYNHLVRLHTMFARDIRLFFLFLCQTDARPESCESLERSEEHTSELQSLMRISYAVFCLKKKKTDNISTIKHRRTSYLKT